MKRVSESDDVLLQRLVENNDESATVAMFLQLYRESSELRHWLREDYARDAKLREKVDGVAKDVLKVIRFAELTNEAGSWREEQRRLKKTHSGKLYGGLTWREIMQLVSQYQVGTLDLGAYLLVRHWRQAGKSSPALRWAGLAFLESILPSGRRRLLKHLNDALAFTKKYDDKANRRTMVGYADWWKLHALFYMLRYPRESYRTRDLRTHLAKLGLQISTKDIRRFCTRHDICRDMRAGRPRKRLAAFASKPDGANELNKGQTGQSLVRE